MAWLDTIEAHIKSGGKNAPTAIRESGAVDLAVAERAAQVAEAWVDAGGSGIRFTLEHVLALVLSCPDRALIPFWERIMLPRHRFQRRDVSASMRAYAGGLALCRLMGKGDLDAREALLRAIGAAAPSDRGDLLVLSLLTTETTSPQALAPFVDLARRTAADDPAFGARYLARCALRIAGRELALDFADGVFVFGLQYDGFGCTFEALSSDTPCSIHYTVQDALGWDGDHPWCLHLDGSRVDPRFEWSPESNPDWIPYPGAAPGSEILPERLGELGLRRGNKIVYHFDFGDNHRMPLKVLRIDKASRQRVRYPRIVTTSGRRPDQYPRYES